MTARPSSATSVAPAAAGLAGAAALAWAGLAAYEPPMGAVGFLAGWTLMMAAMMLPSVAPLVALHRGSRPALAAGYLAVWAGIGLLPYAAAAGGLEPAAPLVLALAGVYELTPLKTACLRRCRSPASFLLTRWGRGAFRLGAEHGVWCVGCCAGLMGVLVLAAAMELWAAALLALVVLAQKALPGGEATARATGVGLIGIGIVLAVT